MKAVVIVGQGPRAIEHLPSADVWVINGPRVPPRWDVLFQLHGLDHIDQLAAAEDIRALMDEAAKAPRRLILPRELGEYPTAEPYPIEKVMQRARPYLTSSVAMAIAMAVAEGYDLIHLDGMMWGQDTHQWGASEGWAVPCVEFWIGVAEGHGIEVLVPPGTGLFRNGGWVYGLQGPGSV